MQCIAELGRKKASIGRNDSLSKINLRRFLHPWFRHLWSEVIGSSGDFISKDVEGGWYTSSIPYAHFTYLAVRISSVPLSFSSLSFSKYISLDCRRTNQRFFQFLLDKVDDPPPFLCSQPCLRASCFERNHKKVSSFKTHQRRFQVFIKPPARKWEERSGF